MYKKIREWIASGKTYTVRFGIGMLMRFFLDEHFTLSSASLVSKIRSGEYYINMMIAWELGAVQEQVPLDRMAAKISELVRDHSK